VDIKAACIALAKKAAYKMLVKFTPVHEDEDEDNGWKS
jgi:hypothetical protein